MESFSHPPSTFARASWMYTDPYSYQYSDDSSTCGIPIAYSPNMVAASSDPCELEGSLPTDTVRYELAASPQIEAANTIQHTPDELSSSCGLSRNGLSSARASVKYPKRRGHARDASVQIAPCTQITRPPQPQESGLIPVSEGVPATNQRKVRNIEPYRYGKPSPPIYADGLIPVDENASTPKEPSSDFDAILRNIGPISKKEKGNKSRERSSRYYDRYSSNFG
ncbi:hypothetical protein F5Y19DRAFT_491326 [Xylariaceae sp. FL1651]|nr:hypothetical protein F5Y19DRAFT_491326 [Xylariaceae sp. FL1651]